MARLTSSTRIKDAGIAIRHSRGRILFYNAGSRNGFEGMVSVCPNTTKQVDPIKKIRTFFVMEKYVEDAKQEKKDVPDLLEAIMKGSGLVKEELRQNLFKLTHFHQNPL